MNILTLQLKRIFFDQIVSGEKTEEYREITPGNSLKYCTFKENGELIGPRKYDRIKFITGAYKGERPYIIVDILNSEIGLLTDENDKEILYTENGIEYIACELIYTLGNVVFNSEKPSIAGTVA
jgi:hypothetical protein